MRPLLIILIIVGTLCYLSIDFASRSSLALSALTSDRNQLINRIMEDN
jgi:hypothetical protein